MAHTEAEKLMAAYIDLANTKGAEAEEAYAAWDLILELAAMVGLAIPTQKEARALLDSLAENAPKEIYSEEQVLAQERNGML
jgi:hypothetical protein